MPLPENHCSILFTTGYKRLPEGGCQAFCFGGLFALGAFFALGLLLEAFAFGFWAFCFLSEGRLLAFG
jgi:hypothetical protein